MAGFDRVRAPGMWLALSQLTDDEMEVFDDHQSAALNARDGGAWAPTSRIIIGGEGLHIWDAMLAIGDGAGNPGVFAIADGSLGGVESGGTWSAASGSTTNLAGTTHLSNAGADSNGGAGHHVISGGKLYVDAGAYVKIRAGGTLAVDGTIAAAQTSVVTLAGFTTQSDGSFTLSNAVPMTLHGDVTVKSDGTLTTEAGSTSTLGGTHNLTGTLQTSGASAEIIVKANGSFTTEELATVSHAGDVEVGGALDVAGTLTVSGTYTQTGKHVKSGSNAQTCGRVGSTTDADGQTYGVEKDVWLLAELTSPRTYTLRSSTAPVPLEGACLRFASTSAGTNENLIFAREDSSGVATIDGTAAFTFVDFVFHSGSWRFAGGKLA